MGRRRVDVPCGTLGFAAPPHRLNVLFLKRDGPLAMLVHSPVGRLREIERWIAMYDPTRVHSGGGLDPHVLRAEFEDTPALWESIILGASTRSLHLSTAGIATLFLENGEDPAMIQRGVRIDAPDAHVREAKTGSVTEGLTDRQIDALSLAVSLGYYEVPHRVSQRELASRLGMSLSGLSRLLRRAEAYVIASHMDAIVDAGAEEGRFRPLLEAEEGHAPLQVRIEQTRTRGHTRP